MKKKILSTLLVTLMIATLVTGCGGKAPSEKPSGNDTPKVETEDDKKPAASDDNKEIVFWHNSTEGGDKKIMDAAIDKFNSTTQSGYTIKSVATQNDNYKEKLVVAMSSGEAPDMYMTWSGGPMNEYIEAGYAQPVDDLMAASDLPGKLMDASIAQGTYNGKVYGVPFWNMATSGVYYNKKMFDELGLKVPATIGELEEVADKLVDNGIIPFALANSTKWTGSMYFMNLAARKGGLEPFAKAVDGSGTFEDEAFVYAGNKIREWTEKGYFPDGVNSLSEDDGQSRQLLYQEKAAMTCIGSWYTTNMKNDSEEFFANVGWFKFPKLEGSDADDSILIGTIGEHFMHFNCTDDKLNAAFEFVEMYLEDDIIQVMIAEGKIPPVKNAQELVTEPLTQQILEAVLGASSVQLWYDQYLPPSVAQAHLDTSQELFGLTMSAEDAAAQFQAAMKEYNDKQ
ncbi:MAG TPA: extracellular solute-binding protein [Epulopiscium sp.]|nr:extracellular solute-binding protein [Candidatus Epulonipiscium sp.]